ncbi:MAG: phage terminase-like protein large subunit-like protein [Frankiales bacterium]|nr:phage terminase-like protein large subunit-like protein [Frankiales bacterium]
MVEVSNTAQTLGWMAQIQIDGEGTRWGDTAATFQMENAAAILEATDDKAVRQFFVPGTRGARKTTDVAALCLTLLEKQAPAYAKGFFIASDEDQASEIAEIAAEMIARTPGLRDLFTTTGTKITHIRTGASFVALANDPSAMGKRPWFIIADELSNWPESKASRKFWTAMTTAIEKVPGCRLVVLTNAGSPAHWAYKRYEKAGTSKYWRVLEIPAPLPWHDEELLERQRENCQTEAEFRRLFWNEWTDEDSRLTTVEQIRDCITTRPRPCAPRPGVRYVAGLDVGWVNDATVLTVAHLEPRAQRLLREGDWLPVGDGSASPRVADELAQALLYTVVVDQIRVWKGTKKQPVDLTLVELTAVDIAQQYGATLIFDPREMVGAEQRARRRVPTEAFHFSPSSKAVLATTMIRLFREQALDLPDDEDLVDELVHVNVVENSTGMVRLDHDPGRHDDRAISLALAAQHLLAGTRVEERLAKERVHYTSLGWRGRTSPQVQRAAELRHRLGMPPVTRQERRPAWR